MENIRYGSNGFQKKENHFDVYQQINILICQSQQSKINCQHWRE